MDELFVVCFPSHPTDCELQEGSDCLCLGHPGVGNVQHRASGLFPPPAKRCTSAGLDSDEWNRSPTCVSATCSGIVHLALCSVPTG